MPSAVNSFRQERIASSPRWDGTRFRNSSPAPRGDPAVAMPSIGEFICGGVRRVPSAPLPSLNPLESWSRAPDSGLRATWLGHSTVLVEIDGWRVLTDPVWGPRASPSRFLGPKRFQPVPVALRELPPLDAVVLSHDHYDHLDYTTMRLLRKYPCRSSRRWVSVRTWNPLASRRIASWSSTGGKRIACRAPGSRSPRHRRSTSPAAASRMATRRLWSSFVIQGTRHRVFFSGDTGPTAEHGEIRARLGPFDLTMLEVGAHHPAWGNIHLGPANALAAHALLGGGPLLPVHWGTFNLALHPWDEPAETLRELAPKTGARLLMPRLGEPVEPAHDRILETWWRGVDSRDSAGRASGAVRMPKAMPWPPD